MYFNSGHVAFVVGGSNNKNVEIYSPDGNCQHKLYPIPFQTQSSLYGPVVGYIDEKIYVCGGVEKKNVGSTMSWTTAGLCTQLHPTTMISNQV